MQMQQPDNQKNLLLAIILSVGVLLLWQMLYAGPKLKEEQERQARIKQQQAEQTVAQPGGAPQAGSSPQAATPQASPGGVVPAPAGAGAIPGGVPSAPAMTREAAVAQSPRAAVDTPTLSGSIGLKGGRIDDIVLKNYRVSVDPKSPNVVLFSPAQAPDPYFAEQGWTAAAGTAVKVPDRDTVWKVEQGGTLTPTSPVTLVWDNGQGVVFRRTIRVDENFLFTTTDEVENKTGAEVRLHPYARVFREGTPKIEGFVVQHEGLIGVLGDSGLQEITYADVQKDGGSKDFNKITGGWLGFTDKYWASALIPDQTAVYRGSLRVIQKKAASARESFQADYIQDAVSVPAGAKKAVEQRLYAGAKHVKVIEAYQAKYNIKKFDLMIDWGWFYFITKPMWHLLDWLYKLLGNFGFAILALTLIIKGAFFPLANKSYESMAKMKKLQPEMERIRDRFKDDKQRQQQELMQLYTKEKINPLAGCLPILLQIPVFFALYKIIFISIDMRHAPFIGWIKDLSAPDPTSLFNLFGLLPIPAIESYLLGHTVGAWAIVMGITMWLQMQLNPQQPDPTQQMIFNWMPPVFTVLLAGFASGLVIYWAWNNVLSLAQQWFIMKRQGVDVPLLDNLKRQIGGIAGLFGKKPASPAKK